MADAKLFGNKITPACKYCENARESAMRDGMALCRLKGVVPPDYSCRRYVYDPIKRMPASLVKPVYDESDFEL